MPILLSEQNGMKCCEIRPLDVSPQIKNVIARTQKAGCFIASIRQDMLVRKGLSFDELGGINSSSEP